MVDAELWIGVNDPRNIGNASHDKTHSYSVFPSHLCVLDAFRGPVQARGCDGEHDEVIREGINHMKNILTILTTLLLAPLRVNKGTYYEGGIRVPLIVKWLSLGTTTIDLRIASGQGHTFFNKEPWRTVSLMRLGGVAIGGNPPRPPMARVGRSWMARVGPESQPSSENSPGLVRLFHHRILPN